MNDAPPLQRRRPALSVGALIIAGVVLEASVDPTEDLDEEQVSQVKAVQAAFDRFAAYCTARIRHCPTGDGPEEAARRMTRLADRPEKKPAPAGGGRTLDSHDLAYAVSDHLDLYRQQTHSLPRVVPADSSADEDSDGVRDRLGPRPLVSCD